MTIHQVLQSTTCRITNKISSTSRQCTARTTPKAAAQVCVAGYSTARDSPKPDRGKSKGHSKKADIQRDFFFDVLNVNATKRDAKQYLSQFKRQDAQPAAAKTFAKQSGGSKARSGVNLGSLYAPSRAIQATPVFQQHGENLDSEGVAITHDYRVALVNIRSIHLIADDILDGIALTLSQLVRLGMSIVVVLDGIVVEQAGQHSITAHELWYTEQGGRLVKALNVHNAAGGQYLDGALKATIDSTEEPGLAPKLQHCISVDIPDLLLRPLARACIPVVPTLAYSETCQATIVQRGPVLAGLIDFLLSSSATEDATTGKALPRASIDRVVIVDSVGGIPSDQRVDGAHVFINLQQEYSEIAQSLSNDGGAQARQSLENLYDLKHCLEKLPATSSALVVSPEEAARSSRSRSTEHDPTGIRTKRLKNPLIHNLLTNRPVISSSLPVARLDSSADVSDSSTRRSTRSTLLKKGMPLTIVPDLRDGPWSPPSSGTTDIALDSCTDVDFPRLLALINDSFRRRLDVEGYLARVRGTVAGVIVAGEYEGGAVLTWESPAGSPRSAESLVPYLDKFAVLQKSQGNAGVADIVFQAMVRSCFPAGVCWRSRSNNPVNKWYFERSVGSWKLPGGQWTMFWTTPNEELVLDERKWADYVAVCQGVVPTWADEAKRR